MASIYSFWADLFDKRPVLKHDLELAELAYGNDMVFVKDDNRDYQLASLASVSPIDQTFEREDKYHLIRGFKERFQKICLVHESFFITVSAEDLADETLSQILDDDLAGFTDTEKELLKKKLPLQKALSKVNDLEKSSIALKYQIEIEVKPDANILSPKHYPEILDDTLSLICPFHSEDEKEELISSVASVVGKESLSELNIFPIKHPLNGWFLVFQTSL